jgi:hypothetical protein
MPSNDETPTLLEAIQHVVEARLRTVHTWLPAIVDSYDEDKQLVDCTAQVALPYLDPDDGIVKYEPAPRVSRCPVGFMGAGGFRITLPIEPGKTTGVLLFSECPIVDWLLKGDAVEPSATRRFHISDAMFVPMLKPNSGKFSDVPRSDSMTVGRDGGPQMVITKDEVQLGGSPSSPPDDYVALATPTKDELKKLHDAINAGFSKLRTDLGSIKNHTHLVAVGGVQSAGPPAKIVSTAPVQVPKSDDLNGLQDPADCDSIDDVRADVTKAK